jgi:hypothetical protein
MSLWMLLLLFTAIKIPLLGMMLWMPFRNDRNEGLPSDTDSSEQDGGSKTIPTDPRDPHPRRPLRGPRPRRGPDGCASAPFSSFARRPSAAPPVARACDAQRLRLR